jgi:two-component system, LytTR family, sensor kinase
VTSGRHNRTQPVFMHPAIFIPSWVMLGTLFALQNWMNLRRWGYHVGTAILFESWGMEFLIWGLLCWFLWRFLLPFILKANVACMLTRVFPLSVAVSVLKEMLWVVIFPNLPLDRPHMDYVRRLQFHLSAEFIDSMVIFWCAFFLFRGIGYYQSFREKENVAAQLEVQLANAKLSALRMQLNPHFLFNAMNSISSLMRTDVNAADNMLEQLSSLLRISLERGDVQLISLHEEMEFIEVYLAMQDQRYAGRVRRDISIDSDLHDVLVPAMFLQPIVENAYAHGLSKIERDGELSIEAHRRNGRVNFTVTNSGVGLRIATNGSNGHGVGLANVQSRLRLHYGNDCTFEMAQVDRTHVKVTVALPYQLSDRTEVGITRFGAE